MSETSRRRAADSAVATLDHSEPVTNGRAAELAPPLGPQIQKRYDWVPVDETNYPGFKLRVWTNMPFSLWRDVYSGDIKRCASALVEIAPEHNGWRDFEGHPYPPASTPEFWTGVDSIPLELFRVALHAIDAAPDLLPNSLRASRESSQMSSAPSRQAAAPG